MPDTHDTRVAPPKPTVPRQPAPNEVLRARPVEGEIDYAELIRDTMKRYRRILAALAK